MAAFPPSVEDASSSPFIQSRPHPQSLFSSAHRSTVIGASRQMVHQNVTAMSGESRMRNEQARLAQLDSQGRQQQHLRGAHSRHMTGQQTHLGHPHYITEGFQHPRSVQPLVTTVPNSRTAPAARGQWPFASVTPQQTARSTLQRQHQYRQTLPNHSLPLTEPQTNPVVQNRRAIETISDIAQGRDVQQAQGRHLPPPLNIHVHYQVSPVQSQPENHFQHTSPLLNANIKHQRALSSQAQPKEAISSSLPMPTQDQPRSYEGAQHRQEFTLGRSVQQAQNPPRPSMQGLTVGPAEREIHNSRLLCGKRQSSEPSAIMPNPSPTYPSFSSPPTDITVPSVPSSPPSPPGDSPHELQDDRSSSQSFSDSANEEPESAAPPPPETSMAEGSTDDNEPPEKRARNGSNFACNHCCDTFPDREARREHVRTVHARRFMCSQCSSRFARRFDLDKHALTVHEGRRPFKCDICSQAFGQKHHMVRHKRTVHGRVREFVCDICQARFARKEHMYNHKRSMHDAQKPFLCFLCDVQVRDKASLKRHLEDTHSVKETRSTMLAGWQPKSKVAPPQLAEILQL